MFDNTPYHPRPLECFPNATLRSIKIENDLTHITISVGGRELTIECADTDIESAARTGDKVSILVHPSGTVSVRRVTPPQPMEAES